MAKSWAHLYQLQQKQDKLPYHYTITKKIVAINLKKGTPFSNKNPFFSNQKSMKKRIGNANFISQNSSIRKIRKIRGSIIYRS